MNGRLAGLVLAIAVAVVGAATLPASLNACAFDDEPDPNFNIDTLNFYYPDAYSVFVRVADARREGALGHIAPLDMPKDEMKARLMSLASVVELQVRAAAKQRAPFGTPPPMSMLFLESMMWVHFPSTIADEPAEIHAPEPTPGDVIAVVGEDALVAVADGRLDLTEAEKRGWLQLFGSGPAIQRFRLAYSKVGGTPAPSR